MKTEELVIDCDGHILEPPDLWEKYIDPKYRDRAMRIRVGDDGFAFVGVHQLDCDPAGFEWIDVASLESVPHPSYVRKALKLAGLERSQTSKSSKCVRARKS